MDDLSGSLQAAVILALGLAAGAATAVAVTQFLRARRLAARLHALATTVHALSPGAAAPDPEAPERVDAEAMVAQALRLAATRLDVDRTAREAFLARALDEVKRPLALLSTSLDLALRRRPEVPELTAALREARTEAERIARLAGRLALYRTAAGAVKLALTDLAAVAQAAGQRAQPAYQQKQVVLAVDAPAGIEIPADAALLGQALDELLANALAATRFGGSVVLRVAREGPLARLSVRDEGAGLPDDKRERAFEPFARGAGGFAPAGLGLSLVREIARGHRGEARLGAPAKGTEVIVDLPVDWPAAR